MPGWDVRVTWIHQGQQRIFEYETGGRATRSVPWMVNPPISRGTLSGMNRAIVQHVLQQAGLGGTIPACRFRPAGQCVLSSGWQPTAQDPGEKTNESQAIGAADRRRLPAGIAFREVIPGSAGRLVRRCDRRAEGWGGTR